MLTHLDTMLEDVAWVGHVVFLFLDLLTKDDDLLKEEDATFTEGDLVRGLGL